MCMHGRKMTACTSMIVSPYIVAAAVLPVQLSASAPKVSASSSAMSTRSISWGNAGRRCDGCECDTRTCASRASCRSRAHSSLLSSSSTSGFALPRGGICVGIRCQAVQSLSWHIQCSHVRKSHTAASFVTSYRCDIELCLSICDQAFGTQLHVRRKEFSDLKS